MVYSRVNYTPRHLQTKKLSSKQWNLKGQCIGMEAVQFWWFHWQWNHNETKGLCSFTVHTVNSRCHTRSTSKTTKYTEGWSNDNKRICVLTKYLLCGESYELIWAKVFDMRTERNVGMCIDNGPPARMHSWVITIDV